MNRYTGVDNNVNSTTKIPSITPVMNRYTGVDNNVNSTTKIPSITPVMNRYTGVDNNVNSNTNTIPPSGGGGGWPEGQRVKGRGEFTGVLGATLSTCIEGQRVEEGRREFTGVLGATLSMQRVKELKAQGVYRGVGCNPVYIEGQRVKGRQTGVYRGVGCNPVHAEGQS